MAGLDVSRLWYNGRDASYMPYEPKKTGTDGSFEIELTFYYGRGNVLATFDHDFKQGGLAIIEPAERGEAIHDHGRSAGAFSREVRVQGARERRSAGPTRWCSPCPAGSTSPTFSPMTSEFDFHLPPGEYEIQGYGSSDVAQIKRPDHARGPTSPTSIWAPIDLAASQLAKLKGKDAPILSPTDARGVSKTVQIADYKGKWVALEFWGYWCGPCVGRALPKMMEIYDDHESERDRFVILTVHSPETTTFADLDEKVKPVVRNTWAGRMIPFPILLDGDKKLQETFGVQHWPTTVLFDPDGKLIGEVQPEELEAKLSKVPLSVTLPRKLERNTTIYFDNPTLKDALTMLKRSTGTEFELDTQALGVSRRERVDARSHSPLPARSRSGACSICCSTRSGSPARSGPTAT